MARRADVNFSDETYGRLKEIADRKGVSMTEVLRDAIALEDWFTEEERSGSRILIERDGETREVVRLR